MTDAELRDAAWEHLEQTTIGWLKPNGAPRPTPGTHWKAAKALLDQIGVEPEPEPEPEPPTGPKPPQAPITTVSDVVIGLNIASQTQPEWKDYDISYTADSGVIMGPIPGDPVTAIRRFRLRRIGERLAGHPPWAVHGIYCKRPNTLIEDFDCEVAPGQYNVDGLTLRRRGIVVDRFRSVGHSSFALSYFEEDTVAGLVTVKNGTGQCSSGTGFWVGLNTAPKVIQRFHVENVHITGPPKFMGCSVGEYVGAGVTIIGCTLNGRPVTAADVTNMGPLTIHDSLPSAGAFGVPWNASGLANLEIGKTNRQVGFRFKAKGGQLASVRAFLKQGTGYSAGDGGDIRLDLYAESGGLPTGPSLANYTVTNPTTSQFQTFMLSAQLNAGTRYCLVWSNTSSGQATNYVSLNCMDCDPPLTPRQPEVSDADLGVFYRDGTGSWIQHSKRTPVMDVVYADGSYQGQQYIDFRSQSGKVTLGSVTQTLIPTEDRTFSKVHAFVSGSGTLGFSLAGRSASVPVNARGWVSADLPVSLTAGQVYSLTLTGPGVTIFPYVKGTNYGFHDPFSEGRSSANASEDWPVYLT